MKYVLYHSSLTNDKSALEKLRAHSENGQVVAEYFDDLSSSTQRLEQEKALRKCRETGAILLILDLSIIQNLKPSETEGIQVKRLL